MNDDYNEYSFEPVEDKADSEPQWTSEPEPEKPIESEYRFIKPDNRFDYMDADFIPRSDAPTTPRYIYTEPPKPKRMKKARRNNGFGRFVAACLICALLGGTAGGYIARSIDTQSAADPQDADVNTSTDSGEDVAAASGSNTKTISSTTGEVLNGTEIYELGCQQTVGVTTSYTTSNIFGQASESSVAGTGFIISTDGYIITNYHVIETAYKNGYEVSVITRDGTTYVAKIVGVEDDNDVAVLKIEAEGLNAVTIGDSDATSVGETIYALGNPLGELTYTLTSGTVSALNRVITTETDSYGIETRINMFQIDAAVNSGNSGGPVYNSYGEVIGIVTAKYQESGVEGLGFAIPINDAMEIADSLIEHGYVTGKASFGFGGVSVDSTTAAYYGMVEGVYVGYVNSGSCAETAGMQKGDIITKLDDTEILTYSDLTTAKKAYKAGDTATVTIYRDGEYLELTVVFDEAEQTDDQETTTSTQQQLPSYSQGEDYFR